MKLTIDRSALLKVLKRCTLPGSYSGNPVLSLIWLGARDKGEEPNSHASLMLRATNGLVGVETTVMCKVQKEGQICVNSKRFGSGAASMNGDSLVVELDGSKLAVKSSSKRRWSDTTQPADGFPKLPEPSGATWMRVRRDFILGAIDKLAHNVADVPNDKVDRKGIFFEALPSGDLVSVVIGEHMVSINGIRDAHVETKAGVEWKCLMPEPMIPLVRDLASEDLSGDTIDLYYDDDYFYCVSETTLVVGARLLGQFPDYKESAARAHPEIICEVPRGAMLDSLKALIGVRTDRTLGVRVQIQRGEKGADPTVVLSHEGADTTFHDSIVLSEVPVVSASFLVDPDMLRETIDAAGENPKICATAGGTMICVRTDAGYTAFVCLMDKGSDAYQESGR